MQSLFANSLVEIIVFQEGLLHHAPKSIRAGDLPLQHVAHRHPHGLMADALVVVLTVPWVTLLFKSRLIVIGVLRHQRLDGDEDRGDALGWAPCWACPCPQDAEADLAIAVEVGVEADSVVSGGDEFDPRWVDGVVGGAAEQEEEEASLVRCVERACDQSMDLCHILRIRDDKHPWWRFLVDGHDVSLYPQDALL